MLWDKLRAKFTLPVLDCPEKTEAMAKKVKHFWKNKVPDFTGALERQRAHWKAFLEYKDSELPSKDKKE